MLDFDESLFEVIVDYSISLSDTNDGREKLPFLEQKLHRHLPMRLKRIIIFLNLLIIELPDMLDFILVSLPLNFLALFS